MMFDIFISYTTRGLTTNEWVKDFCDELKKRYENTFNEDLNIWLSPRETVMTENFRTEETTALKSIPIFLMILEPAFLKSPETIYEKEIYSKIRQDQKKTPNFLKVFKSLGEEGNPDRLRKFMDPEIISTKFFKKNSEDNEEEFRKGSSEYNNAIQTIAKAIRKIKKKQAQKINGERFIKTLEEISSPIIYIAYPGSDDDRSKFINQLVKTIERDKDLVNVKMFPDDLISSGFTSQELDELLLEENDDGEQCIKTLIEKAISIVIPIVNDTSSEAEKILKRLEFQIKFIKESFNRKTLPITIIAAVPAEIYETAVFLKELNISIQATSENVKILKDFNIESFVKNFITDIEKLIHVQIIPPPPGDKHIYIIEPYNVQTAADKEIENRRYLRSYLREKNFVLLPNLRSNAGLKEAAEYQKTMLNLSDGVIIYSGTTEEYNWCLQQQSDTYNTILELGEEKKKKIKKAVYIDPMQKNAVREDYFFFKYDVIINPPPELDNFLWKIQQH